MSATADSTGSAVRRGRPRGGQERGKRGVSSHAVKSVVFRNALIPGPVSPPLFHGENQLSRVKNNAVHGRMSEAEFGQPPRQLEEKRIYNSSLSCIRTAS